MIGPGFLTTPKLEMAENNKLPENFGQTDEERRDIRNKYRNFLDDLQKHRDELVNPESNEIKERLEDVDELFKPVQNAREAVLDSQAMSMIASFGRLKAQALHTDFVRFQPSEFAEKLITFVGGRSVHNQGKDARVSELGWQRMGEATQPFFRRSPAFHYMLGSYEHGPPPVKEKQKIQKEKDNVVGKETVAKQLKDFSESERNETTTEEVERVLSILKTTYVNEDSHPLCFFEFVLNPYSFGLTVENIFHVSFLIKDGLAKIFLDDDDLPVIQPVEGGGGRGQQQAGDVQRHQTIISITPKEWRELVEVFKIEVPTITPRSQLQKGVGS